MTISKLGSALAFCLGAAIVVTGASVSAQYKVYPTTFVNVSQSNWFVEAWGVPGQPIVLRNQDGLDHVLEFRNSHGVDPQETITLSKGQDYETVDSDGFLYVNCASHRHEVLRLDIWPG